jgi:hypothetical protein
MNLFWVEILPIVHELDSHHGGPFFGTSGTEPHVPKFLSCVKPQFEFFFEVGKYSKKFLDD